MLLAIFLYLAFTDYVTKVDISNVGPAKFVWFSVTYLIAVSWIYSYG